MYSRLVYVETSLNDFRVRDHRLLSLVATDRADWKGARNYFVFALAQTIEFIATGPTYYREYLLARDVTMTINRAATRYNTLDSK